MPTYAYPSHLTGRAVTNAPVGSDAFVHVAPSTLAAQAGVDRETYTLGRFLKSEYGRGTPYKKAAIAHTIINKARARGWPLLRMATTVCEKVGESSTCSDTGLYGRQDMRAWRPRANRYASTAQDPTDRDLYVATMCLSGAWPDFTGGADQFLDPATQERLYGAGSTQRTLAEWGVPARKQVLAIDNELWLVRPGGGPALALAEPAAATGEGGDSSALLMIAAGLAAGWWWTRRRRR